MDVKFATGMTRWLAAQEHSGENIGDTETHVIFVELKEPRTNGDAGPSEAGLGPSRL